VCSEAEQGEMADSSRTLMSGSSAILAAAGGFGYDRI
jgi:hypothetical protein